MNVNFPQQGDWIYPRLHGRKRTDQPNSEQLKSIPPLKFFSNVFRNHFMAMCGEFAGTFLFLFFAFSGTQAANSQHQGPDVLASSPNHNVAQILYISLCFGISLAVNVWVFFRVSEGLFNPAAAFGMALIGAVSWARGCLLVVSQILAGIAAAGAVSALFPGPLNVQTLLGGGTTNTQGLFIEMFLTTQLILTIFTLAAENHRTSLIAPIGIGLSLFVAELTGVNYTGGSVNPVRSFGPCVVLHSFNDYHWIYWVGPILGALLASGFYKFIKILEYEYRDSDQVMTDMKIPQSSLKQNNDPPLVNLPSAEPPAAIPNTNELSGGFTDMNCNSVTTNRLVPEKFDASVNSQINRHSATTEGGTVTSTEVHNKEPMGHIYVESSRSYQREPKKESNKHVPRTAGRS